MRCIYFILLLFLLANVSYSQTNQTRFLKHLAADDLYYLRDGLKAIHPYPFTYTSEKDFDRLVDVEVAALPDTVDYYTLRNSIRRIVHYIHCVHTTVLSRKISSKEALEVNNQYLPLEVRWIKDKLYVLKNYSSDTTIYPGMEIVSINGHPVQDITDSLKEYRSGDGTGIDFIRGMVNLPFQFNFLFDLYFPEDTIYTAVVIDSSGREQTSVLKAIYEPVEWTVKKDVINYEFIDKRKYVSLRFANTNTAVLRIKDFGGEQAGTYKKVFAKIKDSNVQNLIIDLRSNYGGSMENANALISFLIKEPISFSLETPLKTKDIEYYDGGGRFQRLGGLFYFTFIDKGAASISNNKWKWQTYIEPQKKNRFEGTVYILVNEHTLSASSYAAAQLKHKAGAILVGSPSGGGEFGNAGYTYASFTLPNSNSKIKVPHNWINYEIDEDNNHGLNPHFIIQPNIEDVILNRDVVMESVEGLLRQ